MTTTPITDQQCYDILTTALEGGYMEEFQVADFGRDDDLNVLFILATCEEVGPTAATYHFGVDAVRRGWDLMIEKYGTSQSYLGEQVREALEDMRTDLEMGTPGVMDAIGCDAVLQLAAWGEVIFG